MQYKIDEAGTPSSPSWEEGSVQNPIPLASRLTEMIADQMAFEKNAKAYHEWLKRLERFVSTSLPDPARTIARLHYFKGKPYKEIEDKLFLTADGCRKALDRALAALSREQAKDLFN